MNCAILCTRTCVAFVLIVTCAGPCIAAEGDRPTSRPANKKVIEKMTQGTKNQLEIIASVLPELGLTGAQEESIDSAIKEFNAATDKWIKEHDAELMKFVGRLGDGHRASAPNDYAAAHEDLKKLTAGSPPLPQVADVIAKIYAALTPEQRTSFDSKRAQRLKERGPGKSPATSTQPAGPSQPVIE